MVTPFVKGLPFSQNEFNVAGHISSKVRSLLNKLRSL